MSGCGFSGNGLRGAANAVPMRNGPPVMTRPPSLATALPPQVSSTTTLVAAGVQGYGRDPDNACFLVVGRAPAAGLAIGATGTIVVALTGNGLAAATGFWAGASWATIAFSGNTSALSLNWTATDVVPGNAVVTIQVEWRVSV